MLLFSLYFYQEISQDSKVLTNATRNLFSSSNWQRSPIKRLPPSNLPARNAQTIPTLQTAARCQAPSSGGTTPTKGSHLLTQSSIKTWLTPIKKSPRAAPAVDIDSKHVTTKRNEVVWPPIHVTIDSIDFISRLYKRSRTFPSCYVDIIEGLQDELFLFQVVQSIQSLTNSCAAPSSDLIWFLVKDVLLNSCQRRLSFATYSLLSEIHARFPARCIAMRVDWGSIKCVTERLTSLFNGGTELQFLNASLALLFIISILSSEVKFTALKTKTTRLARHFSSNFDYRNMREIIAGIKVCLNNHRYMCGYRKSEVGNHLDPTKLDKSLSANYGFCSLELFQNLLKFDIVLSRYKQQVAQTIADELMSLYMDLPSLEARILLLQTLKSHLIRRYLIEVLLMNYCQLGDEALHGNEIHMGARKILKQDFLRCPPRRSSEYSSDKYTAEEVEEYVTLVAYLLQSYMATHSSSLQCIHGDSPISQVNEVLQLTPEDLVLFRSLKWHVSELRKRCLHFMGESCQKLSTRTEVMLEMLAIWTDAF